MTLPLPPPLPPRDGRTSPARAPKLAIETFAVLRGRLDAGAHLTEVLAEACMTPAEWDQEIAAWLEVLAADLERGEGGRFRRYIAAYRSVSKAPTGDLTDLGDTTGRIVRATLGALNPRASSPR